MTKYLKRTVEMRERGLDPLKERKIQLRMTNINIRF